MNKPKSHIFNGKKYKIKWRKPYKCQGLCDDPKAPASDRFIWLNSHCNDKELAELCLHESLHACLFMLDEETVTKTAKDISDFLYKIGFRIKQN